MGYDGDGFFLYFTGFFQNALWMLMDEYGYEFILFASELLPDYNAKNGLLTI